MSAEEIALQLTTAVLSHHFLVPKNTTDPLVSAETVTELYKAILEKLKNISD